MLMGVEFSFTIKRIKTFLKKVKKSVAKIMKKVYYN